MKEAIKHFRKLLTCDQFVITGSYVFRVLGLIDKTSDLDIILVNPNEEAISLLKRLGQHIDTSKYGGDKDHYVVDFNGVEIDFFCTTKRIPNPICVVYDGMNLFLNPIKGIIEKKKGYLSMKHALQLKALASVFMTDKQFEKIQNTSPTSFSRGYY